jgi:ubiquitin carboxyl-terminal hydrolase 14
LEFDALDIVTDDLREKILPVCTKLKSFEKDRAERQKIRKRTKGVANQKPKAQGDDVVMDDASVAQSSTAEQVDIPLEPVARAKELSELEELIHPDLKTDTGCNVTGLYDLVGVFNFRHSRHKMIPSPNLHF